MKVKSSAAGPRLLRWFSLWFDHVYLKGRVKITAASIYTGDWRSSAEALLIIFFAKKIHFQGTYKETQILCVFRRPTRNWSSKVPHVCENIYICSQSMKTFWSDALLVPPRILTDESPTALSFKLCHFAPKQIWWLATLQSLLSKWYQQITRKEKMQFLVTFGFLGLYS